MIIEFGAENYYSFKENFHITMKKNETKKNNDIENILKVMCIKGANASGKTNVLKMIPILSNFIRNSFNYDKEEEMPFSSYFSSNEPSIFYITFLEKGIEYTYELESTSKKILKESIYRKKTTKNILIIEREENKITKATKEFSSIKAIKLKNNSSLISTAYQYDLNVIDPIYKLFTNMLYNVHQFGRFDPKYNYQKISEIYNEDAELFDLVIDILKKCDNGLNNIKILSTVNNETQEKEYFPIFEYIINGKDAFLTYHDQSSGIKSLYINLLIYITSLRRGGLLILDEFDINLHPDLLPMIIDFFETKNPYHAQLILSTHNVEIIDMLGKYKTIFVNKENNESFLYRLDELPAEILRNDRPLTPLYKSGKIGGRPKL